MIPKRRRVFPVFLSVKNNDELANIPFISAARCDFRRHGIAVRYFLFSLLLFFFGDPFRARKTQLAGRMFRRVDNYNFCPLGIGYIWDNINY